MHHLIRAALVLLLAMATAARAQAPLETPDVALQRDAQTWASTAGLSVDEAARQLLAQRETIAVTDGLAAEFRERLAGIVVEHRPAYLIRVLLTGDGFVPDRHLIVGGVDVAIEFRTGALATRAQLVAALSRHQAAIRASLRRPPGLAVDPAVGALVVLLSNADAEGRAPDELEQRFADLTGVPVIVRLLDRTDVNTAVEGGSRVIGANPTDGRRYICTTGFVVTDGARDGVVTAAHCPDTLAFVEADRTETPLPFIGQWGWSYQDVQLHLSDRPLSPVFYADTAKSLSRAVTGARVRASTRVGDVVCHRGERTGYSCAEVQYVDFAPSGDLCGGPCAPTWVAVAGPTCRAGDSGGPVFDGTVALGLVKGSSTRSDGTCSMYYYQSTDFLPEGWRVMVAPGSPPLEGEVSPASRVLEG
jgi:streptogrisin C